MTGQTIRLKRSEGRAGWALLLACLVLVAAGPAFAVSPPQVKLPVLQNIGAVPVQWEGDTNLLPARQTLVDAFPKVVRDTRRFRILNDDLVASLWQDESGRAELREQYEAQGFLGLTVSPREDLVTLTVRLMDAWLKTELLETEVVATDWLANAEPSEVSEKLQALVFRLINRLPVDVSVTSVQGPFITLSGGSEQNIALGDQVEVVRSTILSLHPANRTWLEFQTKPLGSAKIVELKTYSSVARITRQTYDRAIEVGDGARIGAIASRVKFARLAANDGLKDAGQQDTVMVSPLYTRPLPAPAPSAPPAEPAAPAPTPPAQPELAQKEAEQPPEAAATPPPVAPSEPKPAPPEDKPPEDKGPNLWDDLTQDAFSHPLFDSANFYAGPYWWSVSGSGIPSASGAFPLYLLNSLGGGITHTLFYKIKTAFGGGLTFGSTANSSYAGYEGYARIFWEDKLPLVADGIITGWRAGGIATLKGMAINSGAYGGGDWLSGGGFAGLLGTFVADSDRYDWNAEFGLMPLTFGRAGFNGSYQEVQSAFGYKISLAALQHRPARVLAWGAGLDIENDVQTLGNGLRPTYQIYDLRLLASYGF